MPCEKEKMLAGELYLAIDAELVSARLLCRQRLREFNGSDPADEAGRRAALQRLLGAVGDGSWIEPPFHCDYGTNIRVGARFYANFGCIVLDPAAVDIGDDVFFGPSVQIYTATHPLVAAERIKGPESAKPIRIGSSVWIGGAAILLPGVSVGDGTTIGAGSVVTRDLPASVLAMGNPCRVVRAL